MKAKELKEILKNVDDDNPIGFYLIGKEYTDEYDVDLGNPKVICSNGINGELDEGWVDFGFNIHKRPIDCFEIVINKMESIK